MSIYALYLESFRVDRLTRHCRVIEGQLGLPHDLTGLVALARDEHRVPRARGADRLKDGGPPIEAHIRAARARYPGLIVGDVDLRLYDLTR